MQNKSLTLLKLLLLVFAGFLLYPFVKNLLSFLSEKNETSLGLLDLFFDRKYDYTGENGETARWKYQFSAIRHPLESCQSLMYYGNMVLFFVGCWRFFRSGHTRKTLLLFSSVFFIWTLLPYLGLDLARYYVFNDNPVINGSEAVMIRNQVWEIAERLISISVLFFIVRLLKHKGIDNEYIPAPAGSHGNIPVKWMRAMGSSFERMSIIFLGLTFAIFIYWFLYASDRPDALISESRGSFIENKIKTWGPLWFESMLFICYLLTEGLFRVSPFKVISGTEVHNDVHGKASFGQILGRTFARLIPFDAFSFLLKTGWHDAISKTRVVYTHAEDWFKRHCRIGLWTFTAFLILHIWIILHGISLIDSDARHFVSGMNLGMSIGCSLIALFMLMLFTSLWLASVANYAYNIKTDNEPESNFLLWRSLSIWIPLLNFITLGRTMQFILGHLHANYPDIIPEHRLRRRGNALIIWFHLWYYLFSWTVFYVFTGSKMDFSIGAAWLSLGLIFCLITFIRYAVMLKRLAVQIRQADEAGIPAIINSDPELL